MFNPAQAQKEGDLSMSPSVIDDSAAPRAMLEYNIKLSNRANYKLNLFPLLEDLQKNGASSTKNLLDRQHELTKWMSIKRGSVELMPNGEIELPLKIDIPNDAVPGDYFASITFAHGAHRAEAEENAVKMSPPKLFINLKVEDQTVEKATLLKYYPNKKIFVQSIPSLSFDLNNSGNVDLIPQGNIYIYNKRQQELDAIKINPDLKIAPAGVATNFEAQGNIKLSTGKYKARLELEYGKEMKKEVNDTSYFIVITLPFLLLFGIGTLLFIVLLSTLIFRKTYHHNGDTYHKHIQKVSPKNKNTSGDVINLKSK